jgi:hypothetical protein
MNKIKTRKEVLEDLIVTSKNDVTAGEIREQYLQRKILAGSNIQTWETQLGSVQGIIKAHKDLLSFLEEKLKEEK